MVRLAPGQARYEAKPNGHVVGRTRQWGVYDHERGLWPLNTPWTGVLKEDMTQAQAEAEAKRLNEESRA